MENIEPLIRDLPDPEIARRFIAEFSDRHPQESRRLLKNRSLLSDVLTISAYSPLLSTTMLQNPDYVRWLGRERRNSHVRGKEELFESLARFALTNSTLDQSVMLTRFRRRELIRVFLKDIRDLGTIAEITEEISNLADAILEYALQQSRQELDNRFGMPLEIDENGKAARAGFCVVALGKLGSRELNYSSDIDLLFIYSRDGETAAGGSRGGATNKEYFVKLAERVSKLVSDPAGEGGAYRVDHRLRPHGRVGALAVSLEEARSYYSGSAQLWEKQVLIRSRNSAGDPELFQGFYRSMEPFVFSEEETVENALANVLRSKQKIDLEKIRSTGFDVKLGIGGIREIEFIAQALQLAYGADDRWLRAPHTLISLSRLADREFISEAEFTELHEAYTFLRRTEHRLQMEHGLQTHLVPDDPERKQVVARRMGFDNHGEFEAELARHTSNVARIFKRFFDHSEYLSFGKSSKRPVEAVAERRERPEFDPERDLARELPAAKISVIEKLNTHSRPFAALLRSRPEYASDLPECGDPAQLRDYRKILEPAAEGAGFSEMLALLRKQWAGAMLSIAVDDICGNTDLAGSRTEQTRLAEASVEAAMKITERALLDTYGGKRPFTGLTVIGLGKLGGGGMDFHSDLDLLLVYDDAQPAGSGAVSRAEYYAKSVELFVTVLSSMTREGSLYKVDLRLRPDGRNGATSIGLEALLDYMGDRSAVWEWLAYVKARTVFLSEGMPGDVDLRLRRVIHERARTTSPDGLREEALRIRDRLEKEKSRGTRGRSIDLKYGEGGLQDVYFAVRYLQLKTGLIDEDADRSTATTLVRLLEAGHITGDTHTKLSTGYRFLSLLDHNIRLSVGRSTLVPVGNKPMLDLIAGRMGYGSGAGLLEELAMRRMSIREAFEEAMGA